MNLLKKVIFVVLYKRGTIGLMLLPAFGRFLSDKQHVKWYYKCSMGKRLNLKTPKTFNEKLNWLKLYDHDPLYTKLVDKYAVKSWIKDKIGEQYVIPTLGVWDSFEEMEFDKVPNQFVLKTTHGGGNVGVVVCKDKASFDKDAARTKLNRSMQISGYDKHKEWPYKNCPHRIIAEQYLEDGIEKNGLTDYKVHNFNGTPRFILVCKGREKKNMMTDDFFDTEWNHLDVSRPEHAFSSTPIKKPRQLEEMLTLAKTLSQGIPFVRTDFYIVNDKLYFGEMTFFPAGAVKPFVPDSWDLVFGSWLELPKERRI